MKTSNRLVPFSVLFMVILCVFLAAVLLVHLDEAPESVANMHIKQSFQSFALFATNFPRIRSTDLCAGGFITTNDRDLQSIATNIVTNRILQSSPLEYAQTQDEAGITCLAGEYKWVLFSALNNDPHENGKNYYCADSRGIEGNLSVDRAMLQCSSQ